MPSFWGGCQEKPQKLALWTDRWGLNTNLIFAMLIKNSSKWLYDVLKAFLSFFLNKGKVLFLHQHPLYGYICITYIMSWIINITQMLFDVGLVQGAK